MKKSKDDVIFETLINKMLEPHGINIEDIRDSETWFREYSWTYKEELDYRKWFIEYLSKKLRIGRALADKEFQWFNVSFGLKYLDNPFSDENIELKKSYKFYW
jgi:hypothetical protein